VAGDNTVHAAGPVTTESLTSQVGVAVEMARDALKVRNASKIAVSVRVTAITRSGSRHAVSVLGLEPGLQQTIFLDALQPPLTEPRDVVRVDVSELSSSRKHRFRLDHRPRR